MSDEPGRARRVFRWIYFVVVFVLLTALTQIGGLVYVATKILVSLVLGERDSNRIVRGLIHFCVFIAAYGAVTFFAVPPLAEQFDRYPLPCVATKARPVGALNPGYCLLNRHYATTGVHRMLANLAGALAKSHPGTVVVYLDAGFPLLDGFPLPPHMSHGDGRKVDIAFFYQDRRGRYLPGRARSPIGYLAFEQPRPGDPRVCANASLAWLYRWRLGFLQGLWKPYRLEPTRMKAMVRWLTEEGKRFGVEKLFLEPHLVKRLELSSPLIRFQGCRAARHDDHIHVQIRPSR